MAFGNSFQNGLCYFEIPTHYAFLSAFRQIQGMFSTLCRFNEGQLFVSIIETDFFHWLIQTFVWYILGLATFTKAAAISCKVKYSYVLKIKLLCKLLKIFKKLLIISKIEPTSIGFFYPAGLKSIIRFALMRFFRFFEPFTRTIYTNTTRIK